MDVQKIVYLAIGPTPIFTIEGATALVDSDFIVQDAPLILAGLYYKRDQAYLFVISDDGFETSLLTGG